MSVTGITLYSGFVETSYDEVAYPSYSFAQTHPDRLGAIAALFGMSPAPVDGCRVLELGCGNGSNLIPMAFCLPGSRFVGVAKAGSGIVPRRPAVPWTDADSG